MMYELQEQTLWSPAGYPVATFDRLHAPVMRDWANRMAREGMSLDEIEAQIRLEAHA
jgi:hypothetical protein